MLIPEQIFSIKNKFILRFKEDAMRISILLSLLLISSSFAGSLDSFKKRFKMVRNESGELIAVKDRFLITQFMISPYIKHLINSLRKEKERLSSRTYSLHSGKNLTREEEIDEFVKNLELSEGNFSLSSDSNNERFEEVKETIAKALKNIEQLDIDGIFADLKKAEFFQTFEKEMKKALLYLSLNTVAAPQETKYFYRKNTAHEAIKFGLKFAKDRLSSVPLINFASYTVVHIGELLVNQRTFSQNMLMYYLQNYSEQELGFTKEEADKVMSSLFESRISWTGWSESGYASENWDIFGWDKFYRLVRASDRAMKESSDRYSAGMKKINFSFASVTENDEAKIVNLLCPAHMFTKRPATAIYMNKPQKILIERRLLGLANAAVNFLPIPGFLKSLTESVLNSFYVNQASTEGAMAAYFETKEDFKKAQIIYQQSMNPFILIPN